MRNDAFDLNSTLFEYYLNYRARSLFVAVQEFLLMAISVLQAIADEVHAPHLRHAT